MAASVRLEFFQSEAGARVKMDIKQQMGRAHHPNATVTYKNARGNIKTSDYIFARVKNTITIGIFQNGDLVCAFYMIRWW